jgi:aminoglycoside/choline kinase family phosphotransferase
VADSDPGEDELREQIIRLALSSLGGEVEAIREIAPGLGHRRFYRLTLNSARAATAIARVEAPDGDRTATPEIAPEPELEPIRAWLEAAGLPVPARHGADEAHGIELLEDVGERSLELAAASMDPAERIAVYAEACDWVTRLQALEPPSPSLPAFARRLDPALIATKAHKLLEWSVPHVLGRAASPGERSAVESAFGLIASELETAPRRLAHRDMKAANLILRPPGSTTRLAMIDLQGAFLAPPEYDLVCLLRDSHVRLPEREVQQQLQRTRPLLPDAPSADVFDRRFTLITLVRVAKDVSHYLHAADARGDRRYLGFVPTAFENLRSASQHAAGWHPHLERLSSVIETIAARRMHEERA